MHDLLKNQHALFIGGGRGLYAAVVKRLARDGTDVAVTNSKSVGGGEEAR